MGGFHLSNLLWASFGQVQPDVEPIRGLVTGDYNAFPGGELQQGVPIPVRWIGMGLGVDVECEHDDVSLGHGGGNEKGPRGVGLGWGKVG